MSKSTLGRGLSDLLGSRDDAGQPTTTQPRVDGGLRILIDGAAREAEPAPPTPLPAAPKPSLVKTATSGTTEAMAVRILAVAALAGADLALLGWAAWFTTTHEHALGFLAASICALSVLTAALCGCAAVMLMQNRE